MNNPDALPDLKPDNKNGFTVPPPPAPDMGVRTMSSDASSIRTPGGAVYTETKAFNPKDLLGSEPVFNPDSTTIVNNTLPPEPPHKSRGLIIGVGIGVFLLLAGLVGYFILWPLIRKPAPVPVPVPEPTPAPVVIIPQPVPEPVPQPVPPPAFQHTSLFPQGSAVNSASITLSALNVDGINAGLKQAFGPAVPVPTFNEVLFSVTPTGAVDAYQFLGSLVPSISANLSSVIAQDFTAFASKDKDGIWPGYVFTLNNADATTEPNLTLINNIQLSAKTFYPTDPGTEKADFKTGAKPSANFVWVKYKQYTAAGASFNIGQVAVNGKNYLILSTSYQGFVMAAQKLGF